MLIYYLSFLRNLNRPLSFKKPEDNNLKDLITKLIVINVENRMDWKDYFSHPFFKLFK